MLRLTTLFVHPRRVAKLAPILQRATLLRSHNALVDRKYRRLFSSAGTRRKPRPKDPTEEIVAAICCASCQAGQNACAKRGDFHCLGLSSAFIRSAINSTIQIAISPGVA